MYWNSVRLAQVRLYVSISITCLDIFSLEQEVLEMMMCDADDDIEGQDDDPRPQALQLSHKDHKTLDQSK